LSINLKDLFSQILPEAYLINSGYFEMNSSIDGSVVSIKPMDQDGIVLWHYHTEAKTNGVAADSGGDSISSGK